MTSATRPKGCRAAAFKHLTVSKLNYWHKNLNPDREPDEDTGARRFGKATRCFALEPERFARSFVMKLSADDYPGALVTADDMKTFLEANGLPKSGKKKSDLVDRIVASGLPAVVWDLELERHAAGHAGKTFLGKEESKKIVGAAAVRAADPYATAALSGGMPEVSFFVRDPETGVMLKARMDYVRPRSTIDIKTFSNSRGKPVEKAVFEAIFYEGYHLQCVFYNQVRELARRQLASGKIRTHGAVGEAWLKEFTETEGHGFVLVFIESAPPFDLRMVLMKESEAPGADLNVYWSSAHMRINDMKRLYAECLDKYGDGPWRDHPAPHQLEDTDLPMLMLSSVNQLKGIRMTQLVVLEQLKPLELFTPHGVNDVLDRITKEARSHLLDISTADGRKQIASLAYKIAESKTYLDEMGKDLVADQKKHLALVDAERKRIRDTLDALKEEVRRPLTEWEEREDKRVADHEAALAAIPESATYGQTETAATLVARLGFLREYPARDWQEFGARATPRWKPRSPAP